MEKNKYQKLTDERNLIMKKLTSDNRYLMDEIIRNPTTDVSTLAWKRISMKLATLINTAKQLKAIEDSMVMNRIIDTRKSDQVLDFGTPVIVVETNRLGIVTFIDPEDKTVYLDNDESPICQLELS